MIGIKPNHLEWILFAGLVLLPCLVFAVTDCRVVEYPDHFEAVCVGDPKYTPEQPEQADSNPAATKGAQASRKRQRIEDVRSLNAHRFVTVETQPIPDAGEKNK